MKISQLKIHKSPKTRRKFLKSAGIFLTGVSVFNPSILFRRNGTSGFDGLPDTITGRSESEEWDDPYRFFRW